MLIAFLADLHANLQATQAVLDHARDAGGQRFVVLGDIVGYGGDPGPVLDIVTALAEDGALVLRGNHDDMACDPHKEMNAQAATAALWTRQQLSGPQRRYLEDLPLTIEDEDRLYVHADAAAPARWRYVFDAESALTSLMGTTQRMVFCGHVHVPMVYALQPSGRMLPFAPTPGRSAPLLAHRRWHVVLGSVGQPRDGNAAACYALYDTCRHEYLLQRIAYDVGRAAARIRAAGLPDMLSERLFSGR